MPDISMFYSTPTHCASTNHHHIVCVFLLISKSTKSLLRYNDEPSIHFLFVCFVFVKFFSCNNSKVVRKNISSHHKSDQISTHYNKRALTAIAYNGTPYNTRSFCSFLFFFFFWQKACKKKSNNNNTTLHHLHPLSISTYSSATRQETRQEKKTKTWTKNGKTGSVNNSRSIYTYLCIYTTCMALFLSNATTTTSLSFSWSNLLR